jgi:hypothetical protein
MAAVDQVREAIERTVPSFDDRTGDWEAVLAQVRVGEPARRIRSTWPIIGTAAIAAAAALVLFWPGGRGGGGILDRALAAVGTGPVIHVVLGTPPVETYNLERGEYGSVPVALEQWFEPSHGFREVQTVGSQVVENIWVPNVQARFPDGVEQFAGVATAYRRALASGEAALGSEDTVEGRRVYWIRFRVDLLRWMAEHEVAVDAETFEPLFVRVDGGTLTRVLTFETVPLEDKIYAVPPLVPDPGAADDALWSRPQGDGVRSPAEARAALKGALWLGQQFRALPLASIHEFTRETGVPEGFFPKSVRGLDLCYGSGDSCVVSVTLATGWHGLTSRGHMAPYDPPPGTLAFGDEPGVGFVNRDGVHVTLVARDRDEVIAAAKALTPIPESR